VFGGNDGLRGITGDGTYIYVAGNNCIRRIEIASATVQTIAGQCGTVAYVDARGAAARFGFVDGERHCGWSTAGTSSSARSTCPRAT
jgi:hypothetical protein